MASEVKVRSPAPRLPDSPREHVTPRFQPCPGVPLSHRRVSRAHTIFPEGKSLPASYVSTRRALRQQPVEGQFVIDSGSGQAVTLAAPFVRERRVLETVAHTIQGRGHGVGGESQWQVARLERLELGGFRLGQPIAALRTSSVGHIAAEGAIGNLGGEILHRFTVSRGVTLPSEGRCPICFSPCSELPCLPTEWAA